MNNLVIIAGPTAAGKTSLSIKLCQKINGNVISADSMQIYKYMDIGSAKITREEMSGIKHFGIDMLDPHEDYDVTKFKTIAKDGITSSYDENKIPVIVGGTGFYIQSVLYDIQFDDTVKDTSYRNELEKLAIANGPIFIHEMLKEIDYESYKAIHPNNVKRVIRALEYYKETGKPISKHNMEQRSNKSPYNNAFFVITDERDVLYKRIDNRVDKMVESGLIDEVRYLKEMGLDKTNVSMQGLGYKEILDYLDGKITLEESINIIKQETRRFAKRQITWFKREPDAIWINKSEYNNEDEMLAYMLKILEERDIYHE